MNVRVCVCLVLCVYVCVSGCEFCVSAYVFDFMLVCLYSRVFVRVCVLA